MWNLTLENVLEELNITQHQEFWFCVLGVSSMVTLDTSFNLSGRIFMISEMNAFTLI